MNRNNDTNDTTQAAQVDAPAGADTGSDPLPGANPAAQDAAPQDPSQDTWQDPSKETAMDQPPPAAPQDYTFTAPQDVTVDDAVLGAFSDVAKELALPQDAAQTLLDKMAPVMASRQQEQVQAARKQWEADARADAEFGGDKLTENLAVAKRAMDAFATPELKTLLNESGLGNHPEIIRAFYRAGRAISEDGFVAGSRQPASRQNTAQRLYGASNMNP